MRGTIDDMISIRDPPRPNPQNALIVRIGRYTSYTAPSHSKNVHTLLDQKMKNIQLYITVQLVKTGQA